MACVAETPHLGVGPECKHGRWSFATLLATIVMKCTLGMNYNILRLLC